MFALQYDGLNRNGVWRSNEQDSEYLLNNHLNLYLPVFKQSLATKQNHHSLLHWMTKNQLEECVGEVKRKHLIYLGQIEQQHYFSYRVQDPDAINHVEYLGLRNLFKQLAPEQAYLANVAAAMEHWHNTHQHCGYCGSQTYSKQLGFVRHCHNPRCNKEQFPRTDAAVICAITYQDSILLGRQTSWPENRYSVIAGFVEPGESLEQAVAREAAEEVGLRVSNIQYFASQPWPFPQSLMVGFTAESQSDKIVLHDQELEEANWYSRSHIQKLTAQEKLILPFEYSISRALIEQWLNC